MYHRDYNESQNSFCALVEYLIDGGESCLNEIVHVCERTEGWALIKDMFAQLIRFYLVVLRISLETLQADGGEIGKLGRELHVLFEPGFGICVYTEIM